MGLHRCLQRHDISRLPEVTGDEPAQKKFKAYPIGYFHIDIAEVQTAEGKLHLFVGIDRTSKFAFVRLETKATRTTASAFLVALIKPFLTRSTRSSPTMGPGQNHRRQKPRVPNVGFNPLAEVEELARQARESAMDAEIRAYFDAQASDPARRKRQEAKDLRTRYSLGFVDSDIYTRVMGLMRQVDPIAGLADVIADLDARRAVL